MRNGQAQKRYASTQPFPKEKGWDKKNFEFPFERFE